MIKISIYLGALILVVSGCSTSNLKRHESLVNKPIVKMGSKNIANHQDYVLFIESGTKIPMFIEIKGSVFINRTKFKSSMIAKRDMYLYKWKASYNGKDWFDLKKLLDIRLTAKLDAVGGQFEIQIDEKVKRNIKTINSRD